MSAEASDTVQEVQGVIDCPTGVIGGSGKTPNAVIATDDKGTDIVEQFVEAVNGVADELGAKGSTSGGWFRGLLG